MKILPFPSLWRFTWRLMSFLAIVLWSTTNETQAQTLELTATADKTDILTGETYVYTFKYKCASTTTNCTAVTLTANIPSSAFFPTQTIGLPSDIQSYVISPDSKTITFTFKDPLTAGNTGILNVTAQGRFGLVNGTVATMTAVLASGGNPGSTQTINTTLHSSDKFCPYKENGIGLGVDNTTSYGIILRGYTQNNYGTTGIGLLSPGPITVVDQLPAGTVIQSVSVAALDGSPTPVIPANACVIDNANAKITCTFPATTMQVQSQYAPLLKITALVKYPSPTFKANDNVTNNVTVTYQPEGVASPIVLTNGSTKNYSDGMTYATLTPRSCSATLSVTDKLQAPVAKLQITKGGASTLKPGEAYTYSIAFNNTGNVPLNDVVVEDIFPGDITVNQINRLSITNLTGSEVVKYFVKTVNTPTYTEILTNPNNYSHNATSGDRITAYKITISSLPPGSYTNNASYIYFTLNANTTATSVQNCITGISSTSGMILDPTSTSCNTFTVKPPDQFSTISIDKYISQYIHNIYGSFYGGPINPGTGFWNVLNMYVDGGGQPLQNPVVMDLLPLGLDYDNNISYASGTPTADTEEIIPNFNGTGRTLVRLKWNTAWAAPTFHTLSIRVKVNSLAPAGLVGAYTDADRRSNPYVEIGGIKNTAFFTGSSAKKCKVKNIYAPKTDWEAPDLYDLNSNGLTTTDTLCYGTDYVGITSSAQMSSVKWVKGQCDTDYSKYPDFGQTMPGGIANYKLIVTNTGNVPTTNVEIIDILPWVGDKGVIDPQARLTQWRPNLVTPLQTPAGVTVYYSTSSNPCRTDYVPAGPAGCTPANWTTVLPQDPTTIQSLKLDFGTKILKPGDQVELTWDMRAPVDAPTAGEIAWNSFGFKAIRQDNNDPFLASEPFKVGIKLKPNVPGNYGDYVWLDANKNGIQDSGETGVDGVRVELHKDNGDGINDPKSDPVVAFTSTANGGLYLFPNLPVGNYYAVFFLPPGYGTSPANATADDKDSDGIAGICNGNRVTIVPLTNIGANETDLTWDQGIYVEKAAVGNYVWFDENQDNIQNESSANGINGVIVCLYTSGGTLVARDTTSNDIYGRPGYYLFDQLDPGAYYIQFKPTPDKTYTPNSGSVGGTSSDGTDSDADPATGKTATFTLTAGQVDLTWDAGLIIQTGPYKLGNFVWSDLDNDGKFDTGETGINGVTVNLYIDRNNDSKPQADESVTTTITGTVSGVDGIYLFERLPAGNYIVQIPESNFSGALKDYTSSTGNDPAPDPDDNVENDDNGTPVTDCGILSQPILLANDAEPLESGKANFTVDFGFYKCQKPTYSAAMLQANCAGGTGSITVSNVVGGDKVGYSEGITYTGPNYAGATAIGNGTVLSGLANPTVNKSYTVRIFSSNACFKDTILVLTAQVCCIIPARVVSVTNPTCAAAGKIELTSTNGDKYGISKWATYTGPAFATATAVPGTLPAIIKNNISNTADSVFTIRVFNGSNTCFKDTTITVKAALVKPTVSLVAGSVKCAINLQTYSLKFTATNGTVTATAGTVAADSVFNIPKNTTIKLRIQSVDGCKDSLEVTAPTCNCPNVPVPLGQNKTICAGQTIPALTVTVASGLQANWYQTATGGIAVATNTLTFTPTGADTLYVEAIDPVTNCKSTTRLAISLIVNPKPTITVANGFPSCRVNGTAYSIKFVASGGTVTTVPALAVTGDSIANIPLTTTSVKLIITSQAGCKDSVTISAPTCDKPVGSIGDLIWKDVNDNGLQDLPTEKGVAGIKVNLYAASGGTKTGAILQTKTTGNDGLYLFTGLLGGDYIVEIDKTTLKDTCAITGKQNIPSDDTKDSDFNPISGLSQVITLNPVFNPTTPTEQLATNNLTVDAGLVKVCIVPTRTVAATDPTCTVAGKIELTATNGDKYGLSKGATYTGPAYATATAVGTLPILIKGNISHAADSTWTIRVFNKDNTCFKDTTVTVKALVKDATISVNNGFPACRQNGTAYTIKFTKSPAGGVVTAKNVATGAAIVVTGDSIANISLTVAKVRLIVTNGVCKDSVEVSAPTCDKPVGSIGDLIWKDVNDNGLQDLPTEKGVAGIKVNLYAASGGTKTGSVLQTKTTGTDGLYLFTGLLAGDYIVEIDKSTLKDTCAITGKQNIPSDDTKDSDFNPTSGLSQVITLNPVFNPTTPTEQLATNNLTVDAGLVKVCIVPTLNVTATDPTCTSSGKIELIATTGDKYGVSKGATYTGPAYATASAVGTLPTSIKSKISYEADSTWTIRVFNKDNTCFKDTTVTVKALVKDATVSINNGFPACRQNGTAYSIKFTKSPVSSVVTAKNVATGAAIVVTGDSVANIPLTVAKVRLIVTNGVCKDSVEVSAPTCDKPVGSIGDLIWKDVNDNGLQDLPTEKGVAGIKVNLYAASGGTKTGSVLQTKTTGTDGLYLFTGLLAGDYIVEIDKTTLKDTCAITGKQNIPSDDTKDSDFNPTSGLSQVVTINPVFNPTTPTEILATNNLTVDAGLVVPCVKSKVTLTGAPVCSADVQTYSITFNVTNKNGIIKVNKGTLSGSNPYTVMGIPSGATIKITDSLSAVCKFDTLITGPNCNCNPPLPILITSSVTACAGDTFPTLKAMVVGLTTVEWFTQATGGTAVFTGLNYKPSGTVPTTGAVFYAQARSTDPTCPSAISTGRVSATINAQTCIDTVDLALKKFINTKIARIGDVLTYTIKVWNESNKNATGVEVTDSIATTVQFQTGSFVPSRGTAIITGNVIKWTIGNIAANGDTVTLTYRVKATHEGVHFNTAEISKTNEKDKDSTPNNGRDDEDDIDHECFTVPFKLCPIHMVEVSVPTKYTNVQWFKNGSSVPVATGNTVLLSDVGSYTFTATNQICPAQGCCPVIIEPDDNCCPADLCIPFTIKQSKKGKK